MNETSDLALEEKKVSVTAFLPNDSGAPERRATEAFDGHGETIVAAVRRSVPFLGRRPLVIQKANARATTIAELTRNAQGPNHVIHFATDPGGLRGALVLDATAMAFLLDGVFGGDGTQLPDLRGRKLSPAQHAVVHRIASAMIDSLSSALFTAIGTKIVVLPDASVPEVGQTIAIELALGGGQYGTVAIAIARETLLGGTTAQASRPTGIDPRVAAALEDVELELVAELGRVRMKLGNVMALAVGDIVHVDAPLDAAVKIRVEDKVLLEGHPTTKGAQIAIRLSKGVSEL